MYTEPANETCAELAGFRHEVALDPTVPAKLSDELARRIYFVDERIVDFDLVTRDAVVHGVRLVTDGTAEPGELTDKLRRMVAQLPPNHARRRHSARYADDHVQPVFDEMVTAGLALRMGEGQVAVAGPALALTDRLDSLLTAIARDRFEATEYMHPTLVPTATLARSGYLAGFPDHVMFTSRLPADLDGYRDYLIELERGADPGMSTLARCIDGTYCLPPTMCFHTFQRLAGTTLGAPALAITARGKSFRYEGRYESVMERLLDFTIRETVLFGTRQQVHAALDRFVECATTLFDPVGQCDLANDPIFAGRSSAANSSSQRLLKLEFEARLAAAPGRTIAVGSFNLHDTHFGTVLGIGLPDDDTAHSACIGCGLERLTYAALCQHGLSENDWPAALRSSAAQRGGAE